MKQKIIIKLKVQNEELKITTEAVKGIEPEIEYLYESLELCGNLKEGKEIKDVEEYKKKAIKKLEEKGIFVKEIEIFISYQ